MNKFEKLLIGRARLFSQLTGWGLVYFSFFTLISWVRGPGEGFLRATVNVIFMGATFYFTAWVLINRFLEKEQYRKMALFAFLFWIAVAASRTWVELLFFHNNSLVSQSAPGAIRLFFVFLAAFFLLMWFATLYQMLENRTNVELRERAHEARHAEAQLEVLKAQINPHFLFNTLNNIYAASVLQHPRTPDMVLRLSDLLRYVTYAVGEKRVALAREFDQVVAYLELFNLTADPPPDIRFDKPGNSRGFLIEPILLLPLVENALKHGNAGKQAAGFVRVHADISDGVLHFSVENSFDPEDHQKDPQGGVGLTNIRQRLELNYPGLYGFSTGKEGRNFFARLTLQLSPV